MIAAAPVPSALMIAMKSAAASMWSTLPSRWLGVCGG
jgi:hypothetical protein